MSWEEKHLDRQLELIDNIQKFNCERSLKELLSHYEPLMGSIKYNVRNQFQNTPLDLDDIEIVLTSEFIKLVKKYDPTKGSFFPAYVKRYLKFGVITYIRKYTTKNHQVLNYCDSLTDDFYSSKEESNAEEEIKFLMNNTSLTKLEKYIIDQTIFKRRPINSVASEMDLNPRRARYVKEVAIKKIRKTLHSKL